MKMKKTMRAKFVRFIAIAFCLSSLFAAALPGAMLEAKAAPSGMYEITRNINVYYVNEDGSTRYDTTLPQKAYVSYRYMTVTLPEVKVVDLFGGDLGYWKANIDTIPAVRASYDNQPQPVDIYLSPNEQQMLTESKTVNRVVRYFYQEADGSRTPAGDNKENVTFTRTGYIDKNGNKVMAKWEGSYTFKAFNVPTYEGYTPSTARIADMTVGPLDSDIEIEVIYTKNAQPQPEPTPEPQPEPTPEPQPEPTPEPQPEPTPEPQPEPTPEPQPEPTPALPQDGWYRILTAGNRNYSLDVNQATGKDLANIQIYQKNDSKAQRFYLKNLGNGYYNILTGTNNMRSAIDVTGNGKTRGTNIIQYHVNNAEAQMWKIQVNNDGTVTFIAKGSGMALDFAGTRYQNFTNVAIWTPNGSYAQKFVLEKIR